MIKTTKNDRLKYVMIREGWAIYTDSFILIKRGIIMQGSPEDLEKTIYIHVDDWKKIATKKNISLIPRDEKTIIIDYKNGEDIINYKTDVEFPSVDKIQPGAIEYEFNISLPVLESLVGQLKLDKENMVKFKLNKKAPCTIETKHGETIFMPANKN